MAGERTPSEHGTPPLSSDDDISLREHMQRQIDQMRVQAVSMFTQNREYHHTDVELRISKIDQRFDLLMILLEERHKSQAAHSTHQWEQHREQTVTAFEVAESATNAAFAAANKLIETSHRATEEAIHKVEKALEERFNSQARALDKAEIATEKRFEGVNEFRGQLSDQAQSFMPRKESDVRMDALAEKIDKNGQQLIAMQLQITSRLDLSQGAQSGGRDAVQDKRASSAAVYAAVGFGVSILLALITVVSILIASKP